MIGHDEYKYNACSISNDECSGGSCINCEVASYENQMTKKANAEAEREQYTTFERRSNISGICVLVNEENIIAKTDIETLRQLQDTIEFFKKTIIPYHPDHLKQYSNHLRKLRQHNNLGIPDMIFGAKDYPAAFLFGDVVYLIAPRIESE